MHPRQIPSPQLLALADLQSKVVTLDQALGHDLGRRVIRRLVDEGRWRRMAGGLFLVCDVEPDWMARAWGATLLGGPRARLGDESAAYLWGLVDEAPAEIVVWVPHTRLPAARDGMIFRRERAGVREVRSHGDPPRLGVPDTVLDLTDALDADAAAGLLLKAVQSGATTALLLTRAISRRNRLRHRTLLTSMLTAAEAGAETPLEVRYLRDVEQAHGLPRGRRQVRAATGEIRDLKYDPYALIVELDGRLGHDGMGVFRDMYRDNRATVAGEQTLRYGWFDVTGRACRIAAQVSTVCIQRGWPGMPRRCSHCREMPDSDWWV